MRTDSAFSSFFKISLTLFLVSLIALALSFYSSACARFLNLYICGALRAALSAVTSLFPYSLFEGTLLLSPLLIFLSVFYVLRGDGSAKQCFRRFLNFFAAFFLVACLYIFTVGVAYAAPPIYANFVGFEDSLGDGDYVTAAEYLIELAESNATDPGEYISEIDKAYAAALRNVSPYIRVSRRPKMVVFSSMMSRLGCLAAYSFLTGEINVNAELPLVILPVTVAHEYAHAIGASGEADADFMSFYVSVNSDSKLLKYSAAISFLREVLLCIPRENRERLYSRISEKVRMDLKEYSDFLTKYQGRIKNAADKLNSAHLAVYDKSNSKVYSFSLKLIASYVKNNHLAKGCIR